MKKQFLFFILILITVSSIQAQKLSSVEKKSFNYMIKNLREFEVPILAYCLNIDLMNANLDKVKSELIKTSKSPELKKSFYKNANQFDTLWVSYLMNPIVKNQPGKEPITVLKHIEYEMLRSEIKKYPYVNSTDLNVLKQKVYHYYEWEIMKTDIKKGIDITTTDYKKTLHDNLQYILDSGKISQAMKDNYYSLGYPFRTDIRQTLNPTIFLNIRLFNQTEANYLIKTYPYTPKKTNCNCDDIAIGAEEIAQFPGGDASLMRFIREHITYPAYENDLGISGRVLIRFVVDKEGNVCDVEILKKVSTEIDKEAKRVIESLPKWTPAKSGGKAVCIYYNIPINFTLK